MKLRKRKYWKLRDISEQLESFSGELGDQNRGRFQFLLTGKKGGTLKIHKNVSNIIHEVVRALKSNASTDGLKYEKRQRKQEIYCRKNRTGAMNAKVLFANFAVAQINCHHDLKLPVLIISKLTWKFISEFKPSVGEGRMQCLPRLN